MAVSHTELQQFSPFVALDEKQFDAIRHYVHKEELAKGSFLIKRGRPLKDLTFLLSGRVDLVDASFNSEAVVAATPRCREALSQKSPSEVSALAKTDVVVIRVEHQALETLKELKRAATAAPAPVMAAVYEGAEDWMGSLLNSPLFAQVPPTQLQQLFVRFESINVAAGETVVQENGDGDFFYVIESGRARVITRFEGEVASLGPGQFFGEEALVGDTIRNASVIMETDGVLMRLNKEDFRVLLQEPLIHYISTEELARRTAEGQQCQLLDVRIPLEHRMAHVPGSINIPLAALRRRVKDLDSSLSYVITDDGGKRSEVAAHLLCQAGLKTFILEDAAAQYQSRAEAGMR